MTPAFREFMKQRSLGGREKADGYSRDAFAGLTEHEKDEVFELLANELPFSVSWLFLLDPSKAFTLVKAEEEKCRGDGYTHLYILQGELLKHSGDLSYQAHMIEDYPSYGDRLKARVVDAVGNTPISTAALDFFKQVILTEVNSVATTSASIALLDALGIPRATDCERVKYDQLKEELRNQDIQVKLNALSLLACYEKAVF